MLNWSYFIKRFIKKQHEVIRRIMNFQILFFTVTYRIIHVMVMSHSRDDYRRKELKLFKNVVSLCFKCLIIKVI